MRELTERLQAVTGQFERERETADNLHESLRQSEERKRLITEELETREETVQQQRREEERERSHGAAGPRKLNTRSGRHENRGLLMS